MPTQTRPPINSVLLLDAALRLIEQSGLEGLSMRKLGDEFEVQPASIYWYFTSKEDLLDRLADELYGRAAVCLRQREYGALDPDARLRAELSAYREFLLRHAHLAEVFGLSRPVGPGYAMLVEELLDPVRGMRLWPPDLNQAGNVEKRRETMGQVIGLLLDYAHGAVRTQQASISGGRSVVEAIAELDANLKDSSVCQGLHSEFADRFQLGLAALITGLQHRFS